MEKYTYENVIINPMRNGIENLIGKKVYVSYVPSSCVCNANKNDSEYLAVLINIRKDSTYPFLVKRQDINYEEAYSCIIPKKEASKAYIPFSSVDEFLSTYFEKCESIKQKINAHNEDVLCNHGIWLKDKKTEDTYMVTKLSKKGIIIGCDVLETIYDGNSTYYAYKNVIKWNNLLEDYNFLDDTPCGKKL